MTVWLVIGSLFWVYILSILKRAKLPAYYFIFGSVGFFFILFFLSNPYLIWVMVRAVLKGLTIIVSPLQLATIYESSGIILMSHGTDVVSLSIDYECSGVIETAAFWSLLLFYPVYSLKGKAFWAGVGLLWIYCANILRLFLIVIIVHFFGVEWFFFAHSILGRLIFYVLVVFFYYNVFTYGQLSMMLRKGKEA